MEGEGRNRSTGSCNNNSKVDSNSSPLFTQNGRTERSLLIMLCGLIRLQNKKEAIFSVQSFLFVVVVVVVVVVVLVLVLLLLLLLLRCLAMLRSSV